MRDIERFYYEEDFVFVVQFGRYHRCVLVFVHAFRHARIPEGIIIVFAYIRHCQSLYLERSCSVRYNFSSSIAIGGLSGFVSGNA